MAIFKTSLRTEYFQTYRKYMEENIPSIKAHWVYGNSLAVVTLENKFFEIRMDGQNFGHKPLDWTDYALFGDWTTVRTGDGKWRIIASTGIMHGRKFNTKPIFIDTESNRAAKIYKTINADGKYYVIDTVGAIRPCNYFSGDDIARLFGGNPGK